MSKLSEKQKEVILELLEKILELKIDDLDVKKLKDKDNFYRVRKWKIRIIFKKSNFKGIIINIDYRNNIYKK